MKKGLLVFLSICLITLLVLSPANSPKAATNLVPTAYSNLSVGLISKSELVSTSDGYMRVYYNGEKVCIEYYDDAFSLQSKKSISMELSIWGGFYAGSNAYYLVEGKNNTAESDTAEVIRVIKYDTNWNKIGTAKITGNTNLFGGEVRYPFDYGCVEMTEYNGNLYIVTGHEGYVDDAYGQGHQGFLLIEVNTSTMKGQIIKSDLWHSFAQYIDQKDSYLYVLEQSEGSRYTKLSRYHTDLSDSTSFSVLDYGGDRTSAWAIPCYATVDGMAIASKNVLCIGTSIDQSNYDNYTYEDPYNVYLTVTPTSNFTEEATTVKWLTNYSGDSKRFSGVKITKINDNRFMVSWQENEDEKTASANDLLSSYTLHYIFIDGNGNKLTKEFTAAAPISDCQPIVKGSKVVYYASYGSMVNFYSIDSSTGALTKKAYRVAGENATWKLSDGVLTISGTGAISFGSDSYSPWSQISTKVNKIVISPGITSIPENAFCYFDNLTEVEIGAGVKSIGKQAFYRNSSLKKITIPSSVTSIGEDILWTGWYWTSDGSHVVDATIYGYAGSYAETYANKNNISFQAITLTAPKISAINNIDGGIKITWGKVTGAEKYRVYYKTGSGSWTKLADTTSTSYTWKNAKSGTKYTFTVRCVSSDGKTATSSYDKTGKSKTYIAAPQISSVSNVNGGVKISWGKVTGAEKYRVYYKTTGGSWKKLTDTTSTSYTWKNAQSGTKYTFTVRCVSSDGKTPKSGYSSTGKSKTYIAAPKISKINNTSSGVKITWGKVTGAAKYRIYYKKAGSNSWTKLADTTSTSYTWKNAKSGTKYYFTVRCVSSDGKTATSSYDSTGKSKTYIAAPKISSVSNVDGGVKISWGKVTGAEKYRVYYKTGSSGWKRIGDTTSTSYIWKNAKSGTKYTFTVRCVSSDGKTPKSGYDSTGKSKTYIATPQISSVSNESDGVKISWGKVTGAANYRIYYKTGSGSWKKLTDTTSTSYTWKNAKSGTTYYFTVRCMSSDGKTATSSYDATGKKITYTAK